MGEVEALEIDSEGEREFHSESAKSGIEAILDQHYSVTTLFINASVAEQLPLNLTRNTPERELVQQLGIPEAQGSPVEDPLLGSYGAWLRWRIDDYYLHVAYDPAGECISQITLMTPDVAPQV